MIGTVHSDGLSDAPMNLPPMRPERARARARACGSFACFAAFIFSLSRLRSALACPRNFWSLQYLRTRTIAIPEITPISVIDAIGGRRELAPKIQSQGT